jgi:signal transduction histidine kinase
MITRTADAIIDGDLSRRIERTGAGDDFDHLSATLNAMLDRIEGLMENLRQVSSDIAHDLRTPLSRLRQDLEEAQKRELTAAEFKRVVEGAVAEADVLLETFSALLRIAQIEAGTRRSAFRPVDLSEVLRTVVEAYAPAIEESGRTLRAEIADGVQGNGDRGLLSQLFVNLIENALHHTPAGTAITLQLSRQTAGASAEVADTGPGIPPEERAKVFRRFYRLEHSRTTPGSGLGLSTVAAIVELHHAAIELIDNRPGLRVVIRFPA